MATDGVVNENGMLADTTATTIAGQGGINLGAETISLLLRARTKLVNVGGVLPPLKIGGSLSKPSFSVDPTAVVQTVVGILSTGLMKGDVPDMQSQAGQNSCVYTLDHPKASSPSSPADIVKGAGGKTGQQINDVGSKLLKGLFGQ
jgi:hypothetical protein